MLLALVVAGVGLPLAAAAQDTKWDPILSNSHWYVPVPNLIAYSTGNQSDSIKPLPIGDQTLWAIGPASHGVFVGQSEATFAVGSTVTSPSYSSMQGAVTEDGQIRITFTPTSGGLPIIGIGQMRAIGGVPLMEMQMMTGTSLLTTHWAYMTPYNPVVFTPPSPTRYVVADVTSPQWRWTAGTTWQITSRTLFGTDRPGTFKIADYSNGYYWGLGAAPLDSGGGNFTLLGSMTPEGNVLFNLLPGGDSFTSLTGYITGDPTTGSMLLRPYTSSGGPFGAPSVATLMPVSTIASGQTWFLSNVGSTVIPAFTGGTLQVDVSGRILGQNFTVDGSATNRLDQRGNSAVLSGVLSDAAPGVPGRLTIVNSGEGGRIVLTGDSTYSGRTTVEAGATLVVDGSIASPLTVAGSVRGTGTVGGGTTVANGGILAPGNSPGTLTVAGPVVMAPGSTLALDIDGPGTGSGAGNYSRLLVGGPAGRFEAGGTLQPVLRGIAGDPANDFTPALGQQFAVVSAEGGVQGSFASVAQPAGLAGGTRLDVLYGPSTVTLAVTPSAYGDLALAGLPQTANQAAVGRALDAVRPAPGQRLGGFAGSLFEPLYTLPGGALPQALEQLSPSLYGDGLLSARMGFYAFADQVAQRQAAHDGAPHDGAVQVAAGPLGTTAWLAGIGQWTQVASAAAPGFQASLGGGMVGLEAAPAPGLVAGLAFGAGSASTQAWNGASALGTALQASLYGGYASGRFFVDGLVAYSQLDSDTTRPLAAWGSVARGSQASSGVGGRLAAGMRLGWDDWQLAPTIGFSALGLWTPASLEREPNGLAQRIEGQSLTSLQGSLALPVARTITLPEERPLRMRGVVGWLHEFADVTATTVAAFAQAPAAPFAATTAPIDRDALLLGLSADLAVGEGTTLFAGWQATLGSTTTVQAVRAGLRLTF